MKPSRAFVKCVKENTPEMNPLIVEGLAYHELTKIPDYLESRFQMVFKGLDKIKYVGYTLLNPYEAHEVRVKKKDKSYYPIAQTDFYLIRFHLQYDGEDLTPIQLEVPFCDPGGILNISGSIFQISPVLSDRVVSVSSNSIFIDNGRSKIPFERDTHSVVVDGVIIAMDYVYGRIHHSAASKAYDRTTYAKATNVHYLFARYGVSEAFRRYADTEVIVGDLEVVSRVDPTEYTIVKSFNKTPKLVGMVTNLAIAIPKKVWQANTKARTLAHGLIYAADHWPDRITADGFDDAHTWRVLLGHVIKSGDIHELLLAEEMMAHISSIEENLDPPVKKTLHQIGIDVENFFDLLFVINDSFSKWLNESPDKVITMYDKELHVLQPLMYPLTSRIVTVYYKIRSALQSCPPGTYPKKKQIESIIKKDLKQGRMYSIRKLNAGVTSTQYSGDNMYFGFTSRLVPQSEKKLGGKGHGGSMATDDTKKIHVSVAEISSHLAFGKNDPSGRSRISPYLQIDRVNNGLVLRNEKFREMLDQAQTELKT